MTRRLITDTSSALAAVREWAGSPVANALDFETSGPEIRFSKGRGPNAYRHRITGIALAWLRQIGGREVESCYIAVDHTVGPNADLSVLLPLIQARVVAGRVWSHDWRYELQILTNHGFRVETSHQLLDSLIAAWLAGWRFKLGVQELKLKSLALRLGLETVGTFSQVAGKRQARDVPAADMAPYAARDAELTLEIGERAYAELVANELDQHFHSLDMPLVECCRAMAEEGLEVDWVELDRLGDEWKRECDAIAAEFKVLTECDVDVEVEVQRATGEFFKNGKPKLKKVKETQRMRLGAEVGNDRLFSRWMFDELKWLPSAGMKRNDNDVYPVGKELLQTMEPTCPQGKRAVELRLRYQTLAKLRSTYVVGLRNLADQYGDGKLHPSMNLHGTETQRFSSSNPNQQNFPKGSAEAKAFFKTLMVPAGWVPFEADYSQIELRLAAHYSRDENLLNTYLFGEDIHANTMRLVGCERRPAKVLNFSTLYRISGKTLAHKLEVQLKRPVPKEEGQAFITRFMKAYPGIPDYHKRALAFGQKHGFARTFDGYRLPIDPKLYKTKWGKMELLWQAGQTCINLPIQGSAAGLIKTAMVRLGDRWRREGVLGTRVRMVGQVHDSLRIMARPDFLEEARAATVQEMEGAGVLRVPLQVDVKVGTAGGSWGLED